MTARQELPIPRPLRIKPLMGRSWRRFLNGAVHGELRRQSF
jgi:hypothetical protein